MAESPENHVLGLPWHHFICNIDIDLSFFTALYASSNIRDEYSFIRGGLDESKWLALERNVRSTLLHGLRRAIERRRDVVFRARGPVMETRMYGDDTIQRYRKFLLVVAGELERLGRAKVEVVCGCSMIEILCRK